MSGLLVLDTSALLRRYVADPQRPLVVEAMDRAEFWAASAVARTELQLGLSNAATSQRSRDLLWSAVRDDWDAIWEVPVDRRCLARATEIGAAFGLPLIDAIHFAAADRLPRPLRWWCHLFWRSRDSRHRSLRVLHTNEGVAPRQRVPSPSP